MGRGRCGYVPAIRAAQLGAKTAIVEKQYMGGTCLNVGCIPSKAMLHVAESLHHLTPLEDRGIDLPPATVFEFGKAMSFKDKVVKKMTSGVSGLMKANNIDVFDG